MVTTRSGALACLRSARARRLGALLAVVGAALAVGGQPSVPAAAVTTALPAAPVTTTPTDPAGLTGMARPAVSRLAGSDRYGTSVALTRAAFPAGGVPVAYLVSGTSPWHALTTAPAAAARGGAVLLTRPDDIPSAVTTELTRLAPAEIVVVGDPDVLTDAVLTEARGYAPTVRRVAGGTRYRTGEAVVRDAFPSARRAWIATGEVWTDALGAGAVAGAHRAPLITVLGTRASLAPTTRRLLLDLGVEEVTLAGSTDLLSAGIEADLRAMLGEGAVVRAGGADPFAVNAELVRRGLPQPPAGSAYVVPTTDHAGALAAGFLAGLGRRPLLYTPPHCVVTATRATLTSRAVNRVVLVGDEGAVRSLVGSLEPCRSTRSASSPWVLVNKQNPLRPLDYSPTGLVVPAGVAAHGHRLRAEAAAALTRMAAAARDEGAGRLAVTSGYRSAATQGALFHRKLAADGRDRAERWIARGGHSEHQTGLTVDLAPLGDERCSTHRCLGTTPQGRWLRESSWRFGFILRYEDGTTPVTGFGSEPWHFRYVGVPLASAYHRGGWHTYEEFIGAPPAATYAVGPSRTR